MPSILPNLKSYHFQWRSAFETFRRLGPCLRTELNPNHRFEPGPTFDVAVDFESAGRPSQNDTRFNQSRESYLKWLFPCQYAMKAVSRLRIGADKVTVNTLLLLEHPGGA